MVVVRSQRREDRIIDAIAGAVEEPGVLMRGVVVAFDPSRAVVGKRGHVRQFVSQVQRAGVEVARQVELIQVHPGLLGRYFRHENSRFLTGARGSRNRLGRRRRPGA